MANTITYRGIKIHPSFKFLLPGYGAITLFGQVYCKYDSNMINEQINTARWTWVKKMVNHELFHVAQGKSATLGWFGFYCRYLGYWVRNIFKYGISRAYKNIPFEREAYANEDNQSYWEDEGGSNKMGTTHWKDYRDGRSKAIVY